MLLGLVKDTWYQESASHLCLSVQFGDYIVHRYKIQIDNTMHDLHFVVAVVDVDYNVLRLYYLLGRI